MSSEKGIVLLEYGDQRGTFPRLQQRQRQGRDTRPTILEQMEANWDKACNSI